MTPAAAAGWAVAFVMTCAWAYGLHAQNYWKKAADTWRSAAVRWERASNKWEQVARELGG